MASNTPSEILHDIFEICVNDLRRDYSRFLMRRQGDVPWFLGHVCHLWRETAKSTPRLWNYLPPFKLTVENEFLEHHPMFEELLKRSGTQPLHIQFDFMSYNCQLGVEVIPALRPLIATSERWEELTIRGLSLWKMDIIFCSTRSHIPKLRQVQLLFYFDVFDLIGGSYLRESHLHIFATAPVLSEILFHNLSSSFLRSSPIVPWKQLLKYQNVNGGRGWFYEVLKRAENLETLMDMQCSYSEGDLQPIEHLRLRHLQANVDKTQGSFLSSLENLKLPALSTIVITFDLMTTSLELHAAPVLMSLFIRSQCNLKTLILSQGPLYDFEVSELLNVAPNLETLELGDCVNLDAVLSKLEFKATEPTLLPSLCSLAFLFPTILYPRHIRSILRIVESRNETIMSGDGGSSGRPFCPLKNIRVTIHQLDFLYQACLDLNGESGIKTLAPGDGVQSGTAFARGVVHSEESRTIWRSFFGKLSPSKSSTCHTDKEREREAMNAMRLVHVSLSQCDDDSEGSPELNKLSRICQPLITQPSIQACKWMLVGKKDIVYIHPDHELRESSNSHIIVFGTTNGLDTLEGYRDVEDIAERSTWWHS